VSSPFDLRAVLLAKHAQHVALVHFPIALFLVGVVFDLAAQRTKRQDLAAVARFNLLLAAIFSVPVVVTGLAAWQWALEGAKLKGVLLLHLVFGISSSILCLAVGVLHLRSMRKPESPLPFFRLPLELLAGVLIAITGHLGGFVSGVAG
jgi:uncharacterized membrane protein